MFYKIIACATSCSFFPAPQIWMRVSGAETMMSAQPSLYKQLQSMKPPTDVAEAIDIGKQCNFGTLKLNSGQISNLYVRRAQ